MSIQAINKVNTQAPQLAGDAMHALVQIADWADEAGLWYGEMWKLSRKIGIDIPTTNDIVSELVRKGYLRAGQSGRVYEVMPTGRKLQELPADNVGPMFAPYGKEKA